MLISVIIPCFNRANTIEKCIRSVLNQQVDCNVEVLVCDDGSTDDSLRIISSLQSHYDNIYLVPKPIGCIDQGAAFSRNRGLREAKGDFICFLDSDDYYLNGNLQKMSTELIKSKEISYVFCRANMTQGDNIVPWTRRELNSIDREYHVLHRSYCINTNSIMFRKSLLDQTGLFDTSLQLGEDSDLWIRFTENSKGKFIDFTGSVYEQGEKTSNQLTKKLKDTKIAFARRVYQNSLHRSIEKKNGMMTFLSLRMLKFLDYEEKDTTNKFVKYLGVYTSLFFHMPKQTLIYFFKLIH